MRRFFKAAEMRAVSRIALAGALLLVVLGCSSPVTSTPVPVEPADGALDPATGLGGLTANGILLPANQVVLGFGVAGFVESVPVAVGDSVQAGQTLATIDDEDLQRAVTGAQLDLRAAQLGVDWLLQPPDDAEIRLAEATREQAAAELGIAELGVSAVLSSTLTNEALEDAQRAAHEARQVYAARLSEYQRGEIAYWYVDQALQARDAAELALTRVEQQVELQLESARNQVAQAWSSYAAAQEQLDDLLAGADERDVEAAQLDVERAQLALEAARSNLARTVLGAPFDGVVSAVGVRVGEWVLPGAMVAELLDVSRWLVETRNVGELEIAQVEIGQEVLARVNAFRGETLTGWVIAISPTAIVQQGDTTYTLIIELEPTDLGLRPGMTARVEIP